MVLLLSPQLSCLLKKFLAQKETGPMPNQPATRIQDSPSPSQSSTKLQTFQANQGVDSPPTQETDPQSGLPRSSLRHQATFRVSLGTIDGLIHKYVKMETWWVFNESYFLNLPVTFLWSFATKSLWKTYFFFESLLFLTKKVKRTHLKKKKNLGF